MCSPDLFLGLLAILFPPVAVWIKVGICSADSLINIALCCLGYVPGLLHAWYIILKYPEIDEESQHGYQPIAGSGAQNDAENGRVTYYYIAHHNMPRNPPPPPPQRSYGATDQGQPKPAPPPVPSNHPQQNGPAEGGSAGPQDQNTVPPTYAEAVKGDHKIQS